jgi:hypothetical protein
MHGGCPRAAAGGDEREDLFRVLTRTAEGLSARTFELAQRISSATDTRLGYRSKSTLGHAPRGGRLITASRFAS